MIQIARKIVAGGHGILNPSYFCVHSTSNIGATAMNHVNYWRNNPMYAVHLVSDWHECFQCMEYDRLSYQVGNGNSFVEGMEICEASNANDFWKGVEIAADVVAQRLKAHGWGIDRLICHDIARQMWGGTDHTDPIPYFTRWGFSWQGFKDKVKERLEEDEVTNEDIERIAQRVWEIEQGKITANRVYRMTSMLKAICGLGANDTSDPMDKHDSIRDQTIGRWERSLRILKGMVGIDQEDVSRDVIKTPMSVQLSDEQMEKIANMVVERLSVEKDK